MRIAKTAGIAKIAEIVLSSRRSWSRVVFNFGNYPILAILAIRVDLTLLSAVK
jgi:hypothetical protein